MDSRFRGNDDGQMDSRFRGNHDGQMDSRFRGNDDRGILPTWLPSRSPLPSFGAMLSTSRVLLTGYFGLGAAIILWNIAAATLILRGRRSPSVSILATGLAALLLVPGLVVAVSDASLVYGRAI